MHVRREDEDLKIADLVRLAQSRYSLRRHVIAIPLHHSSEASSLRHSSRRVSRRSHLRTLSRLDRRTQSQRPEDGIIILATKLEFLAMLPSTPARGPDLSTMISLGTARQAAQYSPWQAMTVRAASPARQTEESNIRRCATTSCETGEQRRDLSLALNYGYAAGSPQVIGFVIEHMELMHMPPYVDWASCLRCGTTSAIDMLFRMLCNRGGWVLTEDHTYENDRGRQDT